MNFKLKIKKVFSDGGLYMKVELISFNSEAEKIIAAAAKLCYSSVSVDSLMQGIEKDGSEKFLKMLSGLGHESPIEHASFTFAIEGVSRACLAQITRHRIASFSVQSQRYVKEDNFDYVTPPEIENDAELKEIYDETVAHIRSSYVKISEVLKKKHYDNFLKSGENEKTANAKAEKVSIEDARFLLPNACVTKMIVTMNARSLKNFFKLRCCNRAQWEIRELACQMLKLVKVVAPILFFDAGPECLRSGCQEGKMSCKKSKEVKEFFMSNKD